MDKKEESEKCNFSPSEKIINKLEKALLNRVDSKDRNHIAVQIEVMEECKTLNWEEKYKVLSYFIQKYITLFEENYHAKEYDENILNLTPDKKGGKDYC